jgi:predicted GNAT family N-acyltransferase
MSRLIAARETGNFDLRPVSFDVAREFRKRYVGHPALIEDPWDDVSAHIGLFALGKLIGVYRVVSPLVGRLPFSEHAPTFRVEHSDRQIGRFATARSLWTTLAGVALYQRYLDEIRKSEGRVFVATAEWGPISVRRYESLGFVRTGITYDDARYPHALHLMLRSPN